MLSTFGSQSDAWVTLFKVTDSVQVQCTVGISGNTAEAYASSLESLCSRRNEFTVLHRPVGGLR